MLKYCNDEFIFRRWTFTLSRKTRDKGGGRKRLSAAPGFVCWSELSGGFSFARGRTFVIMFLMIASAFAVGRSGATPPKLQPVVLSWNFSPEETTVAL